MSEFGSMYADMFKLMGCGFLVLLIIVLIMGIVIGYGIR